MSTGEHTVNVGENLALSGEQLQEIKNRIK